MTIPAAWQVEAPFGANVGGVSPSLISASADRGDPTLAFDSWLTVGLVDGGSTDVRIRGARRHSALPFLANMGMLRRNASGERLNKTFPS